MNLIPVSAPACVDLPLTGDWVERRAYWTPSGMELWDATLTVVERGARTRDRVRRYRCQFDAGSGSWLLLPTHGEDGEVYEVTPYSCTCKAALCHKPCSHRAAFDALWAAGVVAGLADGGGVGAAACVAGLTG